MAIVLNAARFELLDARIEYWEDRINDQFDLWDKERVQRDADISLRKKVLARVEMHPGQEFYVRCLAIMDKHIARREAVMRKLWRKGMILCYRNERRINEWRMCQLVMSYNE